jgi:hypothetical protein
MVLILLYQFPLDMLTPIQKGMLSRTPPLSTAHASFLPNT